MGARELKTAGEVNAYFDGIAQGYWDYAWWKDGVQYLGAGLQTLDTALKFVEKNRQKALDALPKEGP